MRFPLTRALCVAVVALVSTLMLASGASAANSQVFTDPTGDYGGAGTTSYAVDIISLHVASENDGKLTLTMTIQTQIPQQGELLNGDVVSVWIDADRNPNTGDQGAEAAVHAFGQNGQPPAAQFCRISPDTGRLACEPLGGANFSSVVSPPTTHTLTFTFWQPWARIALFAQSAYFGNYDFAPDEGEYEFEVRADPDGDGVHGVADACVNRPGGRYDADRDGCPGPFQSMPAIKFKWANMYRTGSTVRYVGFAVTEVPANVTVKVRVGNKTFTRKGSGVIAGLSNRTLAAGARITFTASRPGWCSWQRVIRIKPGTQTGYVDVSNRLVRPRGGIDCL